MSPRPKGRHTPVPGRVPTSARSCAGPDVCQSAENAAGLPAANIPREAARAPDADEPARPPYAPDLVPSDPRLDGRAHRHVIEYNGIRADDGSRTDAYISEDLCPGTDPDAVTRVEQVAQPVDEHDELADQAVGRRTKCV